MAKPTIEVSLIACREVSESLDESLYDVIVAQHGADFGEYADWYQWACDYFWDHFLPSRRVESEYESAEYRLELWAEECEGSSYSPRVTVCVDGQEVDLDDLDDPLLESAFWESLMYWLEDEASISAFCIDDDAAIESFESWRQAKELERAGKDDESDELYDRARDLARQAVEWPTEDWVTDPEAAPEFARAYADELSAILELARARQAE